MLSLEVWVGKYFTMVPFHVKYTLKLHVNARIPIYFRIATVDNRVVLCSKAKLVYLFLNIEMTLFIYLFNNKIDDVGNWLLSNNFFDGLKK